MEKIETNAFCERILEKYPNIANYERMLEKYPDIELFGKFGKKIKEGIKRLYEEKGGLLDNNLENLSAIARALHDWYCGGLTPREYESFLPHISQLIGNEKNNYNFLLREVFSKLEGGNLVPFLISKSDEKGNLSFELKEDFLPSSISYQTLRSEERIMKLGTYNYLSEDAKNLSNVARFLFDQTIKQKGIVLDMYVDIEYDEFTPSQTFQTGSFIYSDYKEVLGKIKGYNERLAKDKRKKCNYFPELTKLFSFYSQFGNTFVSAVHNNTYPRSKLEVKISSPDEEYVDNLFEEVKKISHKNFNKP